MYTPVLQLKNLRLLLAYAVMNGHVAHSMDINNAFLQVDLHEEVYMTQPEGFINPNWPHHIYRLKKVLYGLKQAPLTWNQTLNAFLVKISFTTAATNPCLYTLHNHNTSNDSNQGPYDPKLHQVFIHSMARSPLMILSVYMDNLLIVGPPSDVKAVKEKLHCHFHIKDFGPISTILSINVIYDTTASTLDISQQQKILDLATKFRLVGAKLLTCPLPTGTDLHVIEHTPPAHASLKF